MIRTIRHGIEYGVVLLFFALIRLTPLSLTPALSRCLSRLARLVTRKRVNIALANLRAALPERKEAEYREIIREVYLNLTGNAVDSVRPLKLLPMIEIPARAEANLQRALTIRQLGRPLIFVGGHFGDWELLAQYLATRFPGLGIMAKAQRNRFVDRLINRQRELTGGRIIPSHRAPRVLSPLFREQGTLYFVADQDAGKDGIIVDFLGLPTSYARGLALYSYHYNAPLVPVFLSRRNPGFTLEVEPPLEPQPDADRNAEVLRLITLYSERIESQVKKRPGQWLWTHRRWKSTQIVGS